MLYADSVVRQMAARQVGDGPALAEQAFVFLKHFIRFHSPIVFAAKEIKRTINSGRLGVASGTDALAVCFSETAERRRPWEHGEYMPSSWSKQVTKRIFVRPATRRSGHACV